MSRTTIGTLLALLLTTVGFSGTAAAHSHRCKTGCMADLGHGVLEWLHYAIDFVAVGGLLG